MIRILATCGPLRVVHGDSPRQRDLALRIAHDVYLNHRTDVEILDGTEYLEILHEGPTVGNVVFVGRPEENVAVRHLLGLQKQRPPSALRSLTHVEQ